jgi:uncharacterized radical SAM superfamily Fe-S cluster-containing enzyme
MDNIESSINSGTSIDFQGSVLNIGESFPKSTKSICPICLKLIDAKLFSRDNSVFMHKKCAEHGEFEVLIYSDVEDYLKAAKFNKPGSKPQHLQGSVASGCPDDCGLCQEHQQHSCVGVIEITDNCNLNCPVCFADTNNSFIVPFEKVKEMIDTFVKCEGEPEAIQISGGEPTLHPDLIKILSYAGAKGIKYPMLNTNGIKLADRNYAKEIAQTIKDNDMPLGTPLIYLQFDGLTDDIYETLRGKPLLNTKLEALKNCQEFGMNVVLVPTIVKGVNNHELGKIIEFALANNNIKMVNFQPSALVGRYNIDVDQDRRITIPEVLYEIENQTSGFLKKSSFINIPCPYPTCSASSYIFKNDERAMVLTDLFDVDQYMDFIVNRSVPSERIFNEVTEAIDSLLSMGVIAGSVEANNAICTSCGLSIPNIKELVDNITIVQVHAFMDEYNFDLKRAKKCCVTEILPNGRMIPFCVYNTIYRKKLSKDLKELK